MPKSDGTDAYEDYKSKALIIKCYTCNSCTESGGKFQQFSKCTFDHKIKKWSHKRVESHIVCLTCNSEVCQAEELT